MRRRALHWEVAAKHQVVVASPCGRWSSAIESIRKLDAKTRFLKTWMAARPTTKTRSRDGLERADAVMTPPVLVPFANMDFWYLKEPVAYEVAALRATIVVPRGFTTDFASVPSLFWQWMPPTGPYGLPAIVHDWLYWDQRAQRRSADDVFRLALVQHRVPAWKTFCMYRSVRWFGGAYWAANAKEKTSGLGRVLARFPNDARTDWATWRQQPGAFRF